MKAGRRAWGAVAVVVVLVAMHGAAWLWATERLRTGYAAWADAMRVDGWTVSGGAPARAGWPFQAELVILQPAISGDASVVPGGVSWRAEELRLRLSPLAPRILELVPGGVQRVALAALPEAAVTARQLGVSVPLSGEGPAELRGEAVRTSAAGEMAEAATLRASITPGGVRAEAGEIALPQGYAWPLGATVDEASAEVHVASTPGPARPGATPAEQAAHWRDAGGRIEVPSLALRWGPLSAAGSGTGGLDGSLQPRAEATLRLRGWQAALDRLVQGGAIAPGAAVAARAALGLFARASPGSSQESAPGSVTVPILVRDGLLYVGGIPLVRLPKATWP